MSIGNYLKQIAELEKAKEDLHEMVTVLTMKLERLESSTTDKSKVDLLDAKSMLSKEKEDVASLVQQISQIRSTEERVKEENRQLRLQANEMKDVILKLQQRESSLQQQNLIMEHELERTQTEAASNALSLKFAMRRIEDLQFALQEGLSESSESDEGETEDDDDPAGERRSYASGTPSI
ncbi:unnamed protein product [Soboliphyme baturini]|uniref:CGNL1 n=1 Tax=Soboliphyme baturini TaxID=241478 RepID=A0A183J1S1_9BILA|nr:unnamed protein product [Soboliphyme baturini]